MGSSYTPRQRIMNAFQHVASDRVPIDFGSTDNTGITKDAYENLKKYLRIDEPTRILSRNLSTVYVDEIVLKRFNVDTRGVIPGGSDEWRDIELAPDKYIDEWGITYYRPQNSPFYDALKNPLSGELSSKIIREYPWPDPHSKGRLRGMRGRVNYLRGHTDYAIVLHVIGGFITRSQYLRGLGQWLEDLAAEPELLGELLDRTLQYQITLAMDALNECNFDVDVVHFGDDLGMQTGLMFSPKTYREIIKPRQKELFGIVKEYTKAKILLHTCGSNYDILDDLIEIGVDALNPVQTNAKNMEPDKLKREFGDRLTFWGGIDTHIPSSVGSTREIEEEVKRVIDIMAPGGGYILNSIHNIQPNISPENICALFDTAFEYGGRQN